MILFEPLNTTTITVNGLGSADSALLFVGDGTASSAAGRTLGSLSFDGRAYAFGRAPGEGLADGATGFLGFASAAAAGGRGEGALGFDGFARFGVTLVPEFPVIGEGDLTFSVNVETGYYRTQVNEPEGTLSFDGFAASSSVGAFARDGALRFEGYGLTSAPTYELVGAVNVFAQVYGVTGFEPVTQVDDLQVGASHLIDLSILVEQFVPVVDQYVSSMESSRTVVEEVVFAERLTVIYRLLQAEGLALGSTLTGDYMAVARVTDALVLSGAAASYAEAYALVSAAVALGIRADTAYALQAQDGMLAGEDIATLLAAVVSMVDTFELQSVAAGFGQVALAVPEGLALNAAPTTSAQLANVIRDAVRVSLRFALDSGEYAAWTINTESKALSSYAQFPINSFAVFGGRVLGAAGDGIYALDGGTDDGEPIAARVRYALTAMGTGRQKRIPEAYIGYTASGEVLVRVITTDTGEGKVAHVYKLVPRSSNNAPVQGRAKFGKGMRSVYYAFELENVDGADFDFDKIEMHPLELENRTRGNGVRR